MRQPLAGFWVQVPTGGESPRTLVLPSGRARADPVEFRSRR